MNQPLPPELARLRDEIEQIDGAIVAAIAQRVAAARAVGRIKRLHELPTLDPTREAAVVRRAVEVARAAQLEQEDVREIFWHIIGLCRRAQIEGHAEETSS